MRASPSKNEGGVIKVYIVVILPWRLTWSGWFNSLVHQFKLLEVCGSISHFLSKSSVSLYFSSGQKLCRKIAKVVLGCLVGTASLELMGSKGCKNTRKTVQSITNQQIKYQQNHTAG